MVHPERLLSFFRLGSDTSGACSILLPDKGGVVGSLPKVSKLLGCCLLASTRTSPAHCGGLTIFLQVYGTLNLRVVEPSILAHRYARLKYVMLISFRSLC